MDFKTKFELDDIVYYRTDKYISTGKILSISIVENLTENWDDKDLNTQFGRRGILYATKHGTFKESELYFEHPELYNE